MIFKYSNPNFADEERKDTKITSSTETHLHGLQKYTNYSLQVLAFTSGGEGVRSQPIHCQTDQDGKRYLWYMNLSAKRRLMYETALVVFWIRKFSLYVLCVYLKELMYLIGYHKKLICSCFFSVPDAPTSVKALVMSADSILVSWLPPDRPNGIITQYTVYFKEEGKSDSEVGTKILWMFHKTLRISVYYVFL